MKLTRVVLLAIVSLWLLGCDDLGVVAGTDSEQDKERATNPAPPAEGGDAADPGQDSDPDQDAPQDDSGDNKPDSGADSPAPDGSEDDVDSPDDSPDDPTEDSPDNTDNPADDNGSPVPPLPPTRITDNVFLPYAEEVTWHYDNADVVTLGPPQAFAGKQIRPLRHSSEVEVFGDEFFYVGAGSIYYGGLNINAENIPSLGTAQARIEFSSLRQVYDQYTGSGSSVLLKRGTIATEPEYQDIPIVYNWHSQVTAKALVDTVQYGAIPAVAIELTLAIQTPYKVTLKTGIWFSPGLGIVARQFAGLKTRLDYVEGLEPPLVFVFNQGQDAAQPAQQLLYQGVPISDNNWQIQVAYLTESEAWLKVVFDGSGSWRASLQGPALAAGLHVAQVHFNKQGQQQTVLVSVLVQ